jgi:hypothetical protein
MRTRDGMKREALSELAEVIEDLFYVASLLRTSGGGSAMAGRLARIAEDVARERATLEVEIRKPVTS